MLPSFLEFYNSCMVDVAKVCELVAVPCAWGYNFLSQPWFQWAAIVVVVDDWDNTVTDVAFVEYGSSK